MPIMCAMRSRVESLRVLPVQLGVRACLVRCQCHCLQVEPDLVSIVQSIKGREGSTCQVRVVGWCLRASAPGRRPAKMQSTRCRCVAPGLDNCCKQPRTCTCAPLSEFVSIATCLWSGPAPPSAWYVLQLRVLKHTGILEDLQLWRISNTMRVLLLEQIGLWVQQNPRGEITVARCGRVLRHCSQMWK